MKKSERTKRFVETPSNGSTHTILESQKENRDRKVQKGYGPKLPKLNEILEYESEKLSVL